MILVIRCGSSRVYTGRDTPMAQPLSDEQLLSAVARGEDAMFAELVRRYERPLHAYFCRLTGQPAEAADLFQETFLRVWRGAAAFRGSSHFKTWLYAIAANVARSRLRRLRRREEVEGERVKGGGSEEERAEASPPARSTLHSSPSTLHAPRSTLRSSPSTLHATRSTLRSSPSTLYPPLSTAPVDPGPRPNGHAESHEIGSRIAQAVAALPPDQREVFVLKAYQDLSYPAIAAALSRPVGTVKSQMRLALGKLRSELHQLAEAYDLR
jgi:RNA polymerase sigma-70 factor (ECF subfamily)